ncbi:MAG TPA: hypothetical protein VGJ95_03125 [Pseudonocardiaceae bacterium]
MTGYPAFAGTDALVAVVAQPTPTPSDPGGRGEDYGKSGPIGLVVIIVFFIAVFFLARSMNKHLRRIPASFDPPPPADDKPGDDRRE